MASRHPPSPARLLALFALLAGIPPVALAWLGHRVVQQDRALEHQRLRERLDNAASLLARELDRGLTAWEDVLPAAARGEHVALPGGAVFLSFGDDGVVQHRGMRLPSYPRVARPSPRIDRAGVRPPVHHGQSRSSSTSTAIRG